MTSTSPRRHNWRYLLPFAAACALFFGSAVVAAQTLVNCGGEGEPYCTVLDPEFFMSGGDACDRGLAVPAHGTTCENLTRRVAIVDSWTDWALRNQETLAVDEPLNWTSRLATHNANNNKAEGYPFPNQHWSLTDQLRLGSRHFELDLHWFANQLRLCHGKADHAGCAPDDRLYAYAIKEIRDWLQSEPDQIVTIDFEDRSDGHTADVEDPLETYIGDELFRPVDVPDDRMPTRREMLGAGRRNGRLLIWDPQDQHSRDLISPNLTFSLPSGLVIDPDSDAVNLALSPYDRDCRTGLVTNAPGFDVFGTIWQPNPQRFAWVTEDRLFSPTKGLVDEIVVELAVRCRIGLVFMDQMARPTQINSNLPGDLRHRNAIWSWQPADRGQFGDAVVLLGQPTTSPSGLWNRWGSRETSEIHPFVCARRRSESGGDPTTWPDKRGNGWKVTQGVGNWFEGGQRCLDEFGKDWVFSVPRNGYQNVHASVAASGQDVWLSYNDIRANGKWEIDRRPIADAGIDQSLQCTATGGANATLDGSASTDPDRTDVLSYNWPAAPGASDSSTRHVFVPAGSHTFRLIVDDGLSGADWDETTVTVVDTMAPVIASVVGSRDSIWPPNGKMVPVTLSVQASDVCDPNLDCRVVAVTSSETDQKNKKSANGSVDYEITGALSVRLRSERLGPGAGRVYTLTVRCTDASGNFTDKSVQVIVPHDQR
jgi:hypothetical protein